MKLSLLLIICTLLSYFSSAQNSNDITGKWEIAFMKSDRFTIDLINDTILLRNDEDIENAKSVMKNIKEIFAPMRGWTLTLNKDNTFEYYNLEITTGKYIYDKKNSQVITTSVRGEKDIYKFLSDKLVIETNDGDSQLEFVKKIISEK